MIEKRYWGFSATYCCEFPNPRTIELIDGVYKTFLHGEHIYDIITKTKSFDKSGNYLGVWENIEKESRYEKQMHHLCERVFTGFRCEILNYDFNFHIVEYPGCINNQNEIYDFAVILKASGFDVSASNQLHYRDEFPNIPVIHGYSLTIFDDRKASFINFNYNKYVENKNKAINVVKELIHERWNDYLIGCIERLFAETITNLCLFLLCNKKDLQADDLKINTLLMKRLNKNITNEMKRY